MLVFSHLLSANGDECIAVDAGTASLGWLCGRLGHMVKTRISAYDALKTGGPLAARVTVGSSAPSQSARQTPHRKKKHHSVPQYLLKRFSDDKGEVSAYDRIKKRQQLLSPRKICIENNLYTVADRLGTKYDTVEEFFAEIDQQCALFVKSIKSYHATIRGQDRRIAARFIASQFVRASQIVHGIERVGRNIVRRGATEVADNILADTLRTGTLGVDALEEISDFKEHARELEVENIAAELPWQLDLIEQALMARTLNFQIVICPEERIIISDYPIALIGTDDSYAMGGKTPGFQNAAEIWCPLSPELAMIATPATLISDDALRPKLSMIKSRNLRIALDSRRWVIEKPGTQMIRHLKIPKPVARFMRSHDSLWPIRSKVPGERPLRASDMLD